MAVASLESGGNLVCPKLKIQLIGQIFMTSIDLITFTVKVFRKPATPLCNNKAIIKS